MFLNFDIHVVSWFYVIILDFSDKRVVSFKIYNVTLKSYEYSKGPSTLIQFQLKSINSSKQIQKGAN